ncbi:MAG TPA: hypothetical protein VKB35_13680 [Ktedonobacteraceae bacterium]|nr:hypothetical protein [Ktedonobacteraceae bacterium]
MPDLHFSTLIVGSAETVFALLADLAHYDRWLPGSKAFGAITQISPLPVGLGTTYIDAGPAGTRLGEVTEYDPPGNLIETPRYRATLHGWRKTLPTTLLSCRLIKPGWHRANDLQVPENMRLIFQPAYSPEVNPVEHRMARSSEKNICTTWFSLPR